MMARKQQTLVVVFMTVAGIIFIAAVLIFLFIPAWHDVNQLKQEVVDAQTELEAQYNNRKNLIESISKVSRIRQTTEDLKSQFISPGDELVFITRIEELANAHDVESRIQISGTKATKTSPAINDRFEVHLLGTYPNVLAAIRGIERLPNMAIINAVTIHSGDLVENATTTISASVKGSLAFTPEGL